MKNIIPFENRLLDTNAALPPTLGLSFPSNM